METLENQINVGPFRQPSEWAAALHDAFSRLAEPFCLSEPERESLEEFLGFLRYPVYAQVVHFVDLAVADVCCRFRFLYDAGDEVEDVVDVSPLTFGTWEVGPVSLRIGVTDPDYARYLGLDRVIARAVGRIVPELTSVAADIELGGVLETSVDIADAAESESISSEETHQPSPKPVPQPTLFDQPISAGCSGSIPEASPPLAGAQGDIRKSNAEKESDDGDIGV